MISGEFMVNILSVKNVKKVFKSKKTSIEAIKDISFDVHDGEITAIVGTSGCGKSTLLNIIAGLDTVSDGMCKFGKDNPRISYMFQSDALLPWRTVLDNACIGLELLGEKTQDNVKNVKRLLDEYGLGDFINKYPRSLSGGMKQRVG